MISTIFAAGALVAGMITGPGTCLRLSYTPADGQAVAVDLGCNPLRGRHPKGAEACATLKEAGGDPGKIKVADTMCMMIYAPVTAEITGTWRGHKIAWKQTYGNRCELNRATGVLFTF